MTASLLSSRILERTLQVGLSIEPAQLEKLEQYYVLLERWNKKINLTALPLANCPGATIDRLLIEPLLAAAQIPDTPIAWADFGSGGGSPAVPLKIVRSRTTLTMVEARVRKTAFLREVASNLALSATSVLTSRIENLGNTGLQGTCDLVTVRALKVDEALLAAAAVVLRPRGSLLIFRSTMSSVFNDFRFATVAEIELEPLRAGLTVLEKCA